MKKVIAIVGLIVGIFLLLSSSASAQVAVACGELQTVSDLSPGEHEVNNGVVVVSDDRASLTITPNTGGTTCRFAAMNSDGSTPADGAFDGNHYSQTGAIDVIEFAFAPSAASDSSAGTTNKPALAGAGALVGLVAIGLVFATRQTLQ